MGNDKRRILRDLRFQGRLLTPEECEAAERKTAEERAREAAYYASAEYKESIKGIQDSLAMLAEGDAEIVKIKDDRKYLGLPADREPKSIHSAVPDPSWKRKLNR